MRIKSNIKKVHSTKLYKYLAIISITIITILVGMITQPETTVSAQITNNVYNIAVEKVPIRLYYDSTRAASKNTYQSGLLNVAGTYVTFKQNTINGLKTYAIRNSAGVGLGWIREDDRLLPRITVSFHQNGGGTPSFTSRQVIEGRQFGSLPTVSRTGYTFAGWWTTSAASGGSQLATTTLINRNQPRKHTIKSGDTWWGLAATYLGDGSKHPTLAAWSGVASGSTLLVGQQITVEDPAKVVQNRTYYARWTIQNRTFTFNGNGGTSPAAITKTYNSTVGTLPTSTRTNYTFNGWYTATSAGTKLTTTTRMTSNTPYYAQWSPHSFKVTYDANGGSGAPAVQTFKYNSGEKLSTTKPTRTGHTFSHWLYGTTKFAPGAAIPANWGSFTVKAQWTVNSYTATFNANGGTTASPTTITKTYGSTLGTLPTTSRSGYTHNGWYTSSSGGTKISTSTKITGTVTYYAQWTINRTVTFNANGGNAPSFSTKSVTNGTAVGTFPTISRTGHSLKGWYTAASSGTAVSTGTIVSANVIYYAQWTALSYTFSFNGNGGTNATAITRTYNTNIGTLPTSTRSGYTFNGWYTATSGGTLLTATTKVTSTRTYYAQWTINRTVTFNANGGNAPSFATKAVKSGTAIGTLPTISRTGHTHTGWYTATSGGTKISTSTVISANVIYYAQWTANSYKFTFHANGGGTPSPASITKVYNTAVGTLPTISRTGYTFGGWWTTSAASGGTQLTTATKVTTNVNYYARWTINSYKFTFNANGGGTPSSASITKTYNSAVGTLPTISRTGYTFRGWWTTSAASGGTQLATSTLMTANVTYYARWTVNSYTATFNANGGTTASPTTITKTYGSTLGTLPTTTRSGYYFNGWFTLASGGSKISTSTKVTGTVTYYAQWILNRTVTFNQNGGNAPSFASKVVPNGHQFGTLPTVSRTGHTFHGWWTTSAASGGTQLATTTVITSNPTYYARWTANSYTVTFNPNGGNAPSPTTITKAYGLQLGTLPTVTRSGYTFNGWYTATSGGSKVATTTIMTGTTTYYAQWTVNRTVTFNANGGGTPSFASRVLVNGSAFGTLPTISRTGYTFRGWWTTSAASGGTQLATSTIITSNIIYYARWTINSYTFSFNGNGGTNATAITKTYNSEVGTLPTSTRTMYTFTGWFTTTSGGTKLTTTTRMTSNTTYYAQWTANTYQVTYNANGGTGAPATQSFVYNSGAKISTTVPTRAGYTFTHWLYNTTTFAPGQAIPANWGSFGLTAQWKINNYTFSFNGNGGTNATAITKQYNSEVGTLPTSTRSGYTFRGWFTTSAATGGTQLATGTRMTSNVTYYARWTINRTVTFNANGGGTPSVTSRVLMDGTAYGTPPTISRTGYTFKGWWTTSAASGGTELTSSTVITSNITYYARWTINSYTVTWNGNGGTTPTATSKVYNTAVGTLPTTTRTGYTFAGWWTTSAASGGTQIATTTVVTNNVTYYARWTINSYTVNFNANGGNAVASKQYNYNATLGTLPVPVRVGYTNTGWFTSATGGTKIATTTKVTGNITYYAQWTINSYTASFNGNGGTNGTSITKTYNSTLGTLPTSTRSGHYFNGWFTTQTGGTQVSTSTRLTANVTYYAQWLVNRTVTFNANGGNTPSITSKVVPNGHQLGDLPTVTRTGYTHTGWFTAASGGTAVSKTTVVTATVTYYAQWKINTYTFTFNANGGGTPSQASITKNYNTAVGTLPTISRTGYTFRGWWTTSAASGGTQLATSTLMTSNVTYYARWTINSYTVNFNSNGGSLVASKTYNYNLPLGTLPTTTRTGHTFTGWFTAASGGTKIATTTVVTGNITYYAQWTVNNYTATFDGNGGTTPSPTKITKPYDTVIGTLPTTTRSGHYFNGWFTTVTGGTKITTSTKVLNNVTYYAQWLVNRTVTFNANGGNTPSFASKVVPNGHQFGDLPTISRTGNTHTGWFTATSGGTKLATTTVITANVTYYAQWNANNYTATFNANGGNTPSPTTITKLYNTAIGTLPTVTRTGHYFNGWFTAASGGTKISTTTKVTANVTYYAQWLVNRTVTFNANGGNTPSFASKVVPNGHQFGTLPTVTRSGHDFNGWFTATTGGTKLATNTVITSDIIYYAQWTRNEFTVVWDGNGGTSPASKIVSYNSTVGALPTTTRTGYTFLGWYTAKTGGTKITTSTVITKDVSFYAQWIINRTVTYTTHGGSTVSTQTVTDGTVLTSLPSTTRTGYTFNGWFTAQTGGTKVVAPLTVTSNVVLHAQWTINNYTVTFNSNGGSTVASKGYPYNNQLGALPTPTRTGYTLTGWYTSATGGTKVETTTKVTANVTYYAQWSINTYTATFDGNGGSNGTSISKVYNSTLGTLPTSTRVGHTFNGWYTTRTGGTKVGTSTLLLKDITYYAQWTAINYTVTFDVQGGTSVGTTVRAYNTTIGTLPTTTKAGHHFEGWFTSANGAGSRVTSSTRIYGNTTFYAYWIINRTVTFDSNGGTTPNPATKTIVHGRAVGELPVVTRTGHTFNGWFTSRTSGTKVTTTTIVSSDVTYYAQWTAINYTVTFDVQGGSVVSKVTRAYNTTIGTLPTTTKSGHHFEGWFTAANGGGSKVTSSTRIYGNTTYYAYWIVNRTVTFDSNGGTTPNPATKTIVHGRAVGVLPVVTRVGHTLDGWFTSRTSGTKVTESTLVNSDVTYYAQWTAINYTVTFDAQSGTTVSNKVIAYGSNVGTLPTTTRTGYHFEGWYTLTNGGGSKVTTSTRIYGNTTFYAYWIINRTVTFNSNGGTTATPASKIIVHNRAIGTLPTTTRTGYTFDGWFTTRTGGTKLETTTLITSDITYYAHWTPIMYTITWDVQGGVAVAAQQKAYDSTIGTLPTTTRTGYTFLGWYTGVNGTGSSVTTRTVVKGNATYYANWVINRTVTYNSHGGTAIPSITVTNGTVIGELPVSTRTGYTFLGWYTAQTGGTKVTAPLTVTANMTLHAQWRINDYLVTYDAQGGSAVTAEWHTYNTQIGTLPTTTRTGYTFQGWYTAKTGGTKISTQTIVTRNVTYYAQWVINVYDVTWNSNGGESVPVSKVKYGHEIGTLPGPNRVGHTLNGWYTARTNGTMISSTTKVWNHITYYAQWTPVTYTVTFDSQGGSAVNAYRIVYNTSVGTLPVTTRTGYHLEGWFTSANGGGSKVTSSTRIYGNTTFYAYWIVNRTVTFNSNGGNTPSESTRVIVHGRALGELPTTTRTGYTLKGWFTSRTSGTQVTKDTLVTDDVTYYAQWTPLKYSVVFDAQGGSAVATKTLEHDSRLGSLPVTTRTGYHFEGWYTGKNGAGTKITDRTVVTGPATYYAYWIVNRTVLFDLNGGNTQSFNSKVIPHGKAVGTLPTATRVGHTFSGWYTGKTGGTKIEATTIVMSDITYYAQWNPITYTVRFDPLGGVGVPDRRVVYNTSVGTLPHTARVGYVFRGWYTTQTGGTEINERTRVMGNTTYYARWDDHANLTFRQNGGRYSLNTIRVPVGSSMAQVKDLIKAHTFNVGRLTHSSKVFKDILIEEPSTLNSALLIGTGSFNVTQDLVGTVQWSDEVLIDITTGPEVNNKDFTKFTHTNTQGIASSRTFVEGGKTIRQLRVNLAKAGTPIRLLGTNSALEMDVEGYNLNGFKHTTTTLYFDKGLNDTMDIGLWGTQAHIINTLDGKGSPRVALEAMLSRIELMIKFDTQGGLPVKDVMVYYGDAIGTLPTATKEHYDFKGWYTEPLGKGVKLVTSKVFKTSETYYAHWTPKNYTIKFDSTGGTAVANRTVVYNNKLGDLPTPTRAGYLLLGWYTQKNGMGTQVTTETIINGNFTYYAHWTDTVQLKFTGNGVALAPLNVKIGTTVKELRTIIYNRDEIVSKIKHDTQFFQNIEITEARTGLKTNLVSGNDNMVITNHLTGKILWSPNVRYHLTTGPDVNNKPFDTYTIDSGAGKAVIESPVQTYTTGQYAGKTLYYLTVDTRKTGVPITNLGSLSKLNVDIEGYDITGWKNLVTGDLYNEPLTDVISVEQFRGPQAVRTRLNGDYPRVGIEAQLKRISYTVSFDSQGGSNVPSQKIFHGAKLINIEVPTRTKYAFKGWYTQPNGKGEQLTLDTVIKTNRVYYAHWNEILAIKFETQGGSGPIADRNFEKGNTVGTLPLTTLTKHRFVGWFTQQDGKGERVTATRVPQGDETYFAYWREQMTVRFMNLQTQVDVQTVDVGTKLPSLPTVTRAGHTFVGWLIDGTDSYLTKDTLIMGDMVAVAHFTRNITVKFDSQGGTAVADLNMLSGDLLPAIPAPTKTDFNFNGWFTQPGGLGASFRTGVPVYDDITLYAHWTDNEYRVTFDTMGGTPTTSILVIKGDSIGLDGRTQRTGYRFVGWYTEPEYINKVPSLYTPTKSVTLYAKWELIKIHEVSFNTNSDIVLPSLYVTENTSIEKLPSPTRDGYGFLGWYLDTGLTVQVYEGYMPLQDTLLHAKWVKLAEIVNITFDSANGQAVRRYQAVKGQTLPSSYYQTPVREGYRFMGWYVGNQLVSNQTVYQTHTNIVAKWELRKAQDTGKKPTDPSLVPNLTPRPWVPTPYIEPASKPVGEKTIETVVTIDGVQVSEAKDWLKVVTKVTLTSGVEKQVIFGDE